MPAAFNAFASGVIDRSTSQVSIAGVATAESKDSDGVVHDGGFGARIRAIRRGGSRTTANVIASNWLEAGTWTKAKVTTTPEPPSAMALVAHHGLQG